jgi:hypothetical protein
MEDVAWLLEHGKPESYLFVVNSSSRDFSAYPSPSEYTIEFHSPFRNVFGIELLDANVPRTEYTVEIGSNTLSLSINSGPIVTIDVEPGDYTLQTLTDALTNLLPSGMSAEPYSIPYTLTNRSRLKCTYPFVVYATPLARILGFNDGKQLYNSTVSSQSNVQQAFSGPFPGSDTVYISSILSARQSFVPSVSGSVAEITVYADSLTNTGPITATILDVHNTVYGSTTIDPATTTQGTVSNGSAIVAGTIYYLVLSGVGADIFLNTPVDTMAAAETGNLQTWTSLPNGEAIAFQLMVDVGEFVLESPGLCDLTGERFVLIRCPTVETLLYRDRAYETYHGGLGAVSLGSSGIINQNLEFVKLPTRLLQTPIGKLSKLLIRLEKSDGSLYNARGIDHVLTFQIKYFDGTKHLDLGKRPNLHQYLTQKMEEDIKARDTEGAFKSSSSSSDSQQPTRVTRSQRLLSQWQ